jgi:hypothetical protein
LREQVHMGCDSHRKLLETFRLSAGGDSVAFPLQQKTSANVELGDGATGRETRLRVGRLSAPASRR